MTRPLLERLRAGEIIVADGAWGTMLIANGLQLGEPPEVFNLSRREVIEDIAQQYLEAGAEILTTNTFGGSPLRLREAGLEHEVERINKEAVLAIRRAVGDRACVSASIGPCGKLLAPLGDAEPSQVAESYLTQATVLAEAGVDLFCVETMTDLTEARLAVEAARRVAPEVPVIATMTFEATRRGFYTVMGVPVAEAVHGLTEAGAVVLGTNCGNGFDAMIGVTMEFRAQTSLPLLVRPNAGLPESRAGALIYPESPEFFGQRVAALVAAGARMVGGCCGTTPRHIAAIKAAVDGLRKAAPQ